MEHTDTLRAMRMALYELNDQTMTIAKTREIEESILDEAQKVWKAILDDALCLGDRAWLTDRLTQSVYDLQTLRRQK